MAQITWQNVNRASDETALKAMSLAQESFQKSIAGLKGLADESQARAQKELDAENAGLVTNFQNTINGYKSADDLSAAMDSGAIEQQRLALPTFLQDKVRGVDKTALTGLRNDFTTNQAFLKEKDLINDAPHVAVIKAKLASGDWAAAEEWLKGDAAKNIEDQSPYFQAIREGRLADKERANRDIATSLSIQNSKLGIAKTNADMERQTKADKAAEKAAIINASKLQFEASTRDNPWAGESAKGMSLIDLTQMANGIPDVGTATKAHIAQAAAKAVSEPVLIPVSMGKGKMGVMKVFPTKAQIGQAMTMSEDVNWYWFSNGGGKDFKRNLMSIMQDSTNIQELIEYNDAQLAYDTSRGVSSSPTTLREMDAKDLAIINQNRALSDLPEISIKGEPINNKAPASSAVLSGLPKGVSLRPTDAAPVIPAPRTPAAPMPVAAPASAMAASAPARPVAATAPKPAYNGPLASNGGSLTDNLMSVINANLPKQGVAPTNTGMFSSPLAMPVTPKEFIKETPGLNPQEMRKVNQTFDMLRNLSESSGTPMKILVQQAIDDGVLPEPPGVGPKEMSQEESARIKFIRSQLQAEATLTGKPLEALLEKAILDGVLPTPPM